MCVLSSMFVILHRNVQFESVRPGQISASWNVSAAALGKMFCQKIQSGTLIFHFFFALSQFFRLFLFFVPFAACFSCYSNSVRQPAGCCLWCLWADRECSGRPEQRNKPWALPAIKAHCIALDQERGKKKSVAQATTTVPWDFFFVPCAHLQHAKQKPRVIRVGTCIQNSD